jgi:hypothetical protein
LKENETFFPREDSQNNDCVKNRKDLISSCSDDIGSEKKVIPKRKSPRLKLAYSYLSSDKYEEECLGKKALDECKGIQ